MFQDVATVFNRQDGLWYPTVLTGVQVQASEGGVPAALGGERTGAVTLLVPYVPGEPDRVAGKAYLPPKKWRQGSEPENHVTFAAGERFDVLLLGPWEGTEPIRDDTWPEGFFARLRRERDGAYAVTAVRRFRALPHFEIEGR